MSIFKWIELKPVAKQSDKTRESDIGNFKSTSIKIISSHLYEKIILFTVLSNLLSSGNFGKNSPSSCYCS